MAKKNELSSGEKPQKDDNTLSFLNDYIIPKRLIYANSLIQSLKNQKYTWQNDGIKVYIC